MSAQELDVKRAWRAVRRYRGIVVLAAFVGVLGGVAYGVFNPPMYSATSMVMLPPPPATATENAGGAHSIETQVLVAKSAQVLVSAGQNLDPPLTRDVVRERVDIGAVTTDVIEIEAQGTTADQAMALANAVAEVYLVFVTTEQGLPSDVGGRRGARVLEEASTARGGNAAMRASSFGALGGGAGAVLAVIAILAATRGDRRLRLRSEIADVVGLPVLGSVASYRANSVSDWANLLERYTPTAVDSWSLRQTLHRLELDSHDGAKRSLAVLSFAQDRRAMTLGPQLAAFATSIGVPATLVVDSRHDGALAEPDDGSDEALMLHGALPRTVGYGARPNELHEDDALQISVVMVDRESPMLAGTIRTTNTIIGLSAGAVTGEELARLAVAAAVDRRTIDGLLVADPDPSDRTTGRVPQSLRRSSAALPTLLTGARKAAR